MVCSGLVLGQGVKRFLAEEPKRARTARFSSRNFLASLGSPGGSTRRLFAEWDGSCAYLNAHPRMCPWRASCLTGAVGSLLSCAACLPQVCTLCHANPKPFEKTWDFPVLRMKKLTRLSDYQPFSHRVVSVELTFWLHPSATRVDSRLRFEPVRPNADLRLDGRALKLLWAKIDGHACSVSPDGEGLTIPAQRLPAGPSPGRVRLKSTQARTPRLRGFTFQRECSARNARRRGFAASHFTLIGQM